MLTVWSSFIRTDHRSTTRQVQKLNSNIIFRGRNPPKTVRYQFGCSDKCLQGHSHCYSYQRNSGIPTESDPTTPIPRNRQTRNRIVTRSTNCPCKVPQLLFYKAQQLYNQDHKHTKRRWRMRKLLHDTHHLFECWKKLMHLSVVDLWEKTHKIAECLGLI